MVHQTFAVLTQSVLRESEHQEIGDAWVEPRLRHQGRHLSTMVGLVVEQVRQGNPGSMFARQAGKIGVAQGARKVVAAQASDPALDDGVGGATLTPQVGPL